MIILISVHTADLNCYAPCRLGYSCYLQRVDHKSVTCQIGHADVKMTKKINNILVFL